MNPSTHLLIGWLVANSVPINRRERLAVTLAAVSPDIDGIGYIAERLTADSPNRLWWFTDYHHLLHNLLFGVIVAVVCFSMVGPGPGRRWGIAALGFLNFHLHLLCDLAGSRGPDGYQWPIPYFSPFTDWEWTWSGQWALNAWPNVAITIGALACTFYLAWKRGYSPLEMVSKKADLKLVETLRTRFPHPPG
ncbi:MAG: metal-dependent hydrolase [Acidobacteriota bacterium]|nr:MAG: metal-dependent hydrolase [Acidobacteriota bacterium]